MSTLTHRDHRGQNRIPPELFGRVMIEPRRRALEPRLRIVAACYTPDKYMTRMNHLKNYLILMITKGAGTFGPLGISPPWSLDPPCLAFFPPGCTLRNAPAPGQPWDCRILEMDGPRVTAWMQCGWLPDHPTRIAAPAVNPLALAHDELLAALYRDDERAIEMAKVAVEMALVELHYHRPYRDVDCRAEKLQRIVNRWKADPGARVKMADVAAEAGMGYHTLRRCFRRHFGSSPYDFLLSLRIEHASNLLRTSDILVKEVAFQSGFATEDAFRKAFRSATGRSARTFRCESRREAIPAGSGRPG